MTPQFRSLALFTEDPDLVPSTQTKLTCNSFRGSDTLFWPPLALHTHSAHTCTHSGKSHMHKTKTNLSFLRERGLRKRAEWESTYLAYMFMRLWVLLQYDLSYSTTKK